MSFESVIRENTSQVRVLIKINPEKIPNFTFPPVGVDEHRNDRGHRARFIHEHLDTDSRVEGDAEELIDHTEAVLFVQKVDAGYAGEEVVLEVDVLLQDVHAEQQVIFVDHHAELVLDLVDRDAGQYLGDGGQLIELAVGRSRRRQSTDRRP